MYRARRKYLRVYLYFVCVYYIKTVTTKCLCRYLNRKKHTHTTKRYPGTIDDGDRKPTGMSESKIVTPRADAFLRAKPRGPGALGIAQMTRRGNGEDRQSPSVYRGRGSPIRSFGGDLLGTNQMYRGAPHAVACVLTARDRKPCIEMRRNVRLFKKLNRMIINSNITLGCFVFYRISP